MRQLALLAALVAVGCAQKAATPTTEPGLKDLWAKVKTLPVRKRPTFEEVKARLGEPTIPPNVKDASFGWFEMEGLDDNMKPAKIPMLIAGFKDGKLVLFVKVEPFVMENSPLRLRKFDSGISIDGTWYKYPLPPRGSSESMTLGPEPQ
jgi:hypothetical protein